MARTVRNKGALTISDPTGKTTEVNQQFDLTISGVELAKYNITIPGGGSEYQVPFAVIPQTVAFLLNPSSPINVKYNSNTNTAHQITGPCIDFAKITSLYVTPDPVVDVTLEVILIGP